MLKNYVITALRNLQKQKGYAFINVVGLAVGLAGCLLIGLYVLDEWRYDRHHAEAERIYRINMTFFSDDRARQIVATPSILAPYLRREVAGVETAVRFYQLPPVVVAHEDRRFQETGFLYADSTVFDVFTIPFIAGTSGQALTRPNTIVLTETAVRKYFGTQIRAANFLTYVLVEPGAGGEAIQHGLDRLVERYAAQAGDPDIRIDMEAQPLLAVHLYTDFDDAWAG